MAFVTSQTCTKPSDESVATKSFAPTRTHRGVTSTTACPLEPLIVFQTRLSVDV